VQAVTAPSSPCDTVAAQDLIRIVLVVPTSVVTGRSAAITATGIDAAGNRSDITSTVSWTSSNFLAASASRDGRVYGIGAGDAIITATLGGVGAGAAVSVLPVELERLELVADTEVAPAGEITAWHVIGHYNDDSSVDLTASAAWSSSDQSVATVDEPGQVRAVAGGMATITAASGTIEASAPMLVQ
jgi:hypothetical protein